MHVLLKLNSKALSDIWTRQSSSLTVNSILEIFKYAHPDTKTSEMRSFHSVVVFKLSDPCRHAKCPLECTIDHRWVSSVSCQSYQFYWSVSLMTTTNLDTLDVTGVKHIAPLCLICRKMLWRTCLQLETALLLVLHVLTSKQWRGFYVMISKDYLKMSK